MVTRATKSSEASESRGEAGEEAGKEGGTWRDYPSSSHLSPVYSLSLVLPSLD